MSMRLSIVSLNQVWENKEENILLIENYLLESKKFNSNIVIFPEMTLTGFSMNCQQLVEPFNDSKTVSQFKYFSNKYDLVIVFGVALSDDERVTNNLVMVKPDGECAFYEKLHPFSFAKENQYFQSGTKVVVSQVDGVCFGWSICYDLRFPELFSILADSAKVIVNIANWPEKRIMHWFALLKARAIEQQVYVIGVNRVGVDGNGLNYIKSSVIYDPNGVVVESIEQYDDMDVYNIDLIGLDGFRRGFPTRQDRKNEFYSKNLARDRYVE